MNEHIWAVFPDKKTAAEALRYLFTHPSVFRHELSYLYRNLAVEMSAEEDLDESVILGADMGMTAVFAVADSLGPIVTAGLISNRIRLGQANTKPTNPLDDTLTQLGMSHGQATHLLALIVTDQILVGAHLHDTPSEEILTTLQKLQAVTIEVSR